jgi:hypothetical protein
MGVDLKTERHRLLIRKNYVYLLTHLESVLSGLLDHLIAADVLEMHEADAIKSETSSVQQNEKLLAIMDRKAVKKFDTFVEKLECSGQGHVVATIQGKNFRY